jgi:hypothetical protein
MLFHHRHCARHYRRKDKICVYICMYIFLLVGLTFVFVCFCTTSNTLSPGHRRQREALRVVWNISVKENSSLNLQ